MTADECIAAALARCTDLGAAIPSAKSVWYRRIGIRQGQIFSKVTTTDPDYFGVTAVVVLVAQAYALSALNPRADRINDVRVANPGTSGYTVRQRVNLVILEDVDAMLSPRVTIRDQILAGVQSDLSGVTSLTLDYAKRPAASSTIVGATQLELPEQFQDLLAIDLAKQMIRKLLDVEPARRDGWMQLLSAEESDLFGTLDNHVRYFVGGEQRRFRPASPPIAGSDSA